MEDRTIKLDSFEDSTRIYVEPWDDNSVWINMNRMYTSMRIVLKKEQAQELIKNLQDVVDTL